MRTQTHNHQQKVTRALAALTLAQIHTTRTTTIMTRRKTLARRARRFYEFDPLTATNAQTQRHTCVLPPPPLCPRSTALFLVCSAQSLHSPSWTVVGGGKRGERKARGWKRAARFGREGKRHDGKRAHKQPGPFPQNCQPR